MDSPVPSCRFLCSLSRTTTTGRPPRRCATSSSSQPVMMMLSSCDCLAMLPGRWFGTFREHCLANEGQKHMAAHSFGARDVCIETHTYSYTWELLRERVCGVIEWILTCLAVSEARWCVCAGVAFAHTTTGERVFFGLLCDCPSFRQTKQEIGGCDRPAGCLFSQWLLRAASMVSNLD